jgi:hypothetical protein
MFNTKSQVRERHNGGLGLQIMHFLENSPVKENADGITEV